MSAPTANTILEALGVVEVVVQDVIAFAAGKPVAINVDGYTGSVVVLAAGPSATYPAVTGSFLNMLLFALGEASAFAAGGPIALAVKEGNTWYGVSISKAVPVAA